MALRAAEEWFGYIETARDWFRGINIGSGDQFVIGGIMLIMIIVMIMFTYMFFKHFQDSPKVWSTENV